jgi:hypothetical protein
MSFKLIFDKHEQVKTITPEEVDPDQHLVGVRLWKGGRVSILGRERLHEGKYVWRAVDAHNFTCGGARHDSCKFYHDTVAQALRADPDAEYFITDDAAKFWRWVAEQVEEAS